MTALGVVRARRLARMYGQPADDNVERADSDAGFVLLDVLLGIAVLGLLLLTAITSIGPMRTRSYRAAATSDVRQVAQGIERAATDGTAGYPTTVSADATTLEAVNLTPGNVVGDYQRVGADDFTVCVASMSGTTIRAYAIYESLKGAVTASGAGAPTSGCGAASAPSVPWTAGTSTIACPQVTSAVLINSWGSWMMAATFSSTMSPSGTTTFPQMWPQYAPYTTSYGAWETATTVLTGGEYRESSWRTLSPGTHTFGVRAQETRAAGQTAAQGCTQGVRFTVPSSSTNGQRVTGTVISVSPTP